MKKVLMIAAAAAFVLGVSTMAPANANAKAFSVKKCKVCHKVPKKKIGPAWKDVAAAYGNADALAKVFKDGFKKEDRKFLAGHPKWKHKAGLMTSQYKKLIKGHEDEAAKALFAAVKRGKI